VDIKANLKTSKGLGFSFQLVVLFVDKFLLVEKRISKKQKESVFLGFLTVKFQNYLKSLYRIVC
jgi:hypothetical protein